MLSLEFLEKEPRKERQQRIQSICNQLSLTLNPQGKEYLQHDLTDLSIDFLCPSMWKNAVWLHRNGKNSWRGKGTSGCYCSGQLGLVYFPSVSHQNIHETQKKMQKSPSHHKPSIMFNTLSIPELSLIKSGWPDWKTLVTDLYLDFRNRPP